MKNQIVYIILLLFSYTANSQEIMQQSKLELDDVMSNDNSYLCRATTSIKLNPGFAYIPNKGNEMNVEIDRYSVYPPDDGCYGGPMPYDDGVVGTLPSSLDVSSTGGAIYSIDIKLPNAIGTMMPKLSFVYNNQSGNGIMGWSWNVSGLSSIDRVPQTEYHDGNVTDIDFVNDRFAIDGQRLIMIGGDFYGADRTEYKTEIDNMDKIVAYSDNKSPQRFIVWKSDGSIWEYGSTSDSKLEAQHDSRVILKWQLSKISDRNGNSIIFKYDKNVSTGESYVNNIQYTYNENAGVMPAYKISFVYASRELDPIYTYVSGNLLVNNRLLKNVMVTDNYSRQTVLNYSLDYDAPGYYGVNYFLHYRLKSVGLTIGEDKINPTRILWNSEKTHYPSQNGMFCLHQLNKSVFSNVPFVGDFNGDGFSDVLTVPYKIQNTYSDYVTARVYINNGDGTFADNPIATVQLDKNLEWVYVLDLNGDRIDDIISYAYDYYANMSTINFYILHNNVFVNKSTCRYENNVVVLPGKYVSDDNKGIVVFDAFVDDGNDKMAEYIRYENGAFKMSTVTGTSSINGKDNNYMALDVSGDGLCELMVLDNDGYRIYKNKNKNTNGIVLSVCAQGQSLTKEAFPFPNDYNGDGKTDVLYYDTSKYWNVVFSKGDDFDEPRSCTQNTMLRNVVLNSKDRYRYSLKELESPRVAIRTADFDGDGIADVGVMKNMAGNYYMEIGFKPLIRNDNTCVFAFEKRYYMPINYSHQTVQIGRFLPQENVSILSGLPRKPHNSAKAYITSLLPHSAYYSVERVIDGLGNMTGLSYDYLMHKNNAQEKFFTFDNIMLNNDIRCGYVPVSALKSDTVFNVNEKAIVSRYQYHNAFIHEKGHGFLGFEKIIARCYIDGELVQKEVKEFGTAEMSEHALSMPKMISVYKGEDRLIRTNMFSYKKYICAANGKVVTPLMTENFAVDYDFDKQGKVKKTTIERKTYESDMASGNAYDKIVRLNSVVTGYSDDYTNVYPEDGKFVKEITIGYNDDLDDWIINRPRKIIELRYDKSGDFVGSVRNIEYNGNRPFLVSKETRIPNVEGNLSDSLLLSFDYEYDKVGNMVRQTITSPSFVGEKTLKYEYNESNQYRYKTKTIDELGREIKCEYDKQGLLVSTTDHNGFVIRNEESLSGTTDMIILPNGIVESNAIRWSKGHEYAPSNASYYKWNKTTGQSESMTFYHRSGLELRTVKFDIDGNAVFVDKEYDDYGNVMRQSMPYEQGSEKMFVNRLYDKYGRLIEISYPSGLCETFAYDGDVCRMESITHTGEKRGRKDVFNVMGWLISTEDADGNVINYEYYSDGLVKSAQIGDDENTKISVSYDNNRNKKSLSDPNYGTMRYEYDALGNVKKITNPQNNTIEFQYDILGRLLIRKEKDPELNMENVVKVLYDERRGRNGLIKEVLSDNHSVKYAYDDNLRLINTVETINGEEYETSYTYDAADRVSTICYPSGVSVSKRYSNSGYEKEIYDADRGVLLWRTTEMESSGQVAKYELGNGTESVYSYDPRTMAVKKIYTYGKNDVLQNLCYEYDAYGNMISRRNINNATKESFKYDKLNRLVEESCGYKKTGSVVYDDMGNISEKESRGVRVVYESVYDESRPNILIEAKTDDDRMAAGLNQEMDYSTYENVVSIEKGDNNVVIDYGISQDRVFMKYVVDGVTKTKTYVGNCEIIHDGVRRFTHTFLSGPNGIFAVYTTYDDGGRELNYVHKDNLGSWCVITNENCDVVQELQFDAWGNVNKIYSTHDNDGASLLYDRGYTGHEHLVDFGLVNMNGRMYDPVMSMMLSPDNNVQMPQMFQNYNRYSYCYNNPLRYNDPSGEWVESVVLGVVGGAANVLFNAGNIDSFGEGALLFGVGFAKGFLTEYTMGQSWLLQVGVGALMEGVASGVNQMVAVGCGDFKFSGDDWNSIKTSALYGLGSGLVNSMMYTYVTPPTADEYGTTLQGLMPYDEISVSFIAISAHALGCWFSGQPFMETMKFKDVGLNFKMLEILLCRELEKRIAKSDFANDVVKKRQQEIKESVLADLRLEEPPINDIEMSSELFYTCIDHGRLYVSGNILAMIPATIIPIIPKPYYNEVTSFPLSYSLFRTIFFENKE